MQDENKPEDNGADQLPAKVNSSYFTSSNQPTGARKSMGWFKKKQGRKLMKALLQMTFEGDVLEGGTTIPNPIKQQASVYFGIPPHLITVEMVMAMRQIGLAIQKGDTNAFNSAWEKAYGKSIPLDDDDDIEEKPLVVNLHLGPESVNNFPEIKETEHEQESNAGDNGLGGSDVSEGDNNIGNSETP